MMKALWLLFAACLPLPASAQLRLPGLPNLPSLPAVPTVQQRLPSQRPLDTLLAPANLTELRAVNIDTLLRRHPRELQRDPRGEPVVRGELLALPSTPARREQLLAEGFVLLREQVLDGLDERWLVLQPPQRVNLADALDRLRRADPDGHYDFHHLYTASVSVSVSGGATLLTGSPTGSPAGNGSAAVTAFTAPGLRLGLIDGGVDRQHPALATAAVRVDGCGGSKHPSAHGTAVASLLVGNSGDFRGALPDGRLWAADVYCDAPTGGSVQAIAEALAWMAREQVAVINISLVGPPNKLLERTVAALVARGHLLVAAVGNDGPAAAPLYPAAWAGVVAVTATDARRRLLPEAGRGPHVAFAAPGADLAAASRGEARFEVVRGTSFAAPLVAGLLAAQLQRPDPAAAALALAALSAQAVDLGATGRDALYGWGLVGETLRIDPTRVTGKR